MISDVTPVPAVPSNAVASNAADTPVVSGSSSAVGAAVASGAAGVAGAAGAAGAAGVAGAVTVDGADRTPPMRFSVDGWDPSYGVPLEAAEQLAESTATVAVDMPVPTVTSNAVAGPTPPMRFSVDGWDPSYGAPLEAAEQLAESTATVAVDIEVPIGEWRAIDVRPAVVTPAAMLFVDGVRRIEARVWIDDAPGQDSPVSSGPGSGPGSSAGSSAGSGGGDAAAALCASYAAGVVCSSGGRARLVLAERRRGLFSIARHASDIVTTAGTYQACYAGGSGAPGSPLMTRLSQALQRKLAEAEEIAAVEARSALQGQGLPAGDDLLVLDGPLHGRQHLLRTLGYIKAHHTTYLPPELNALVARLAPGQRTPVFLMGTTWDRHSWYLRLPGGVGAPWAGIVRIECAADLPKHEVIRLANLSQACLGRFASAAYKDSRAPQNLYPIGGLERELRHRLGDPQLLYRALRQASHR